MKILIADQQEELRDLIGLHVGLHYSVEVLQAEGVHDARKKIRENPELVCVISGYRFRDGVGSEIFQELEQSKLSTTFVLCSSYSPAQDERLKAAKVLYIPKPWITENLKLVLDGVLGPWAKSAPKTEDENHCGIRLSTLLKYGMITHDLWLRLSPDHFVKVFREDDFFDITDLGRFEAKKIDFLYIRNEDGKQFVEKLSKTVGALLAAKDLPQKTAFQVSSDALEFAAELNSKMGLTPEAQKLIHSSVELAIHSMQRTPELGSLLKLLGQKAETYFSSHSVALAYISCGLASLLGWSSETCFQRLTLASFFHDITLGDSELTRFQTLAQLRDSGRTLDATESSNLLLHPEQAAALLGKLEQVPPDTHLIVLQHHERPDGSGFPKRLAHTQIAPLSCVFILSHELLSYFFENEKSATIPDFLAALPPDFQNGNFKRLLQVLKT